MEVTLTSQELVKSLNPKDVNRIEKLSIMDVCNPSIYVSFGYFFENKEASTLMSMDHIKSGLLVVLEEYPELAGRLHDEEEGQFIYHSNHGVKIVQSKANFDFQAVKDANYSMKVLPEKQIFLLVPEFQKPVLNVDDPICILHLIYLTDGSMMLVTAINHRICDAQGMIHFTNALAFACKHGNIGKYKNLSDRSVAVGNGETPLEFEFNRGYFVPPNFDFPAFPPTTYHTFNITFESIKTLQKTFTESNPDVHLSKNDIVSAIFWKSTVEARANKKMEDSMMAMIVNSRKKLFLPEEYIGNVVPALCQSLKTNDIVDMSVECLAGKIREFYKHMTKDFLVDLMNWLETCQPRNSIMPSANIFGNDVLISSLARFKSIYESDFGAGNPLNVKIPVLPIAGILWIFPSPDNNALRLEFALEQEEMKVFLESEHIKKYFTVE